MKPHADSATFHGHSHFESRTAPAQARNLKLHPKSTDVERREEIDTDIPVSSHFNNDTAERNSSNRLSPPVRSLLVCAKATGRQHVRLCAPGCGRAGIRIPRGSRPGADPNSPMFSLHRPSGLFPIELWVMIRGRADPGDLRSFAEAIVTEDDRAVTFENSFDTLPYRGDRMWDHCTAYREDDGPLPPRPDPRWQLRQSRIGRRLPGSLGGSPRPKPRPTPSTSPVGDSGRTG